MTGRAVLVTGAAAGIGEAIVRAFVRAGDRVAVTDIDGAAAQRLSEQLGGGSISAGLDVTDAAQTRAVFQQAYERLGGLDVVCANAGVSSMEAVAQLSEAEWDRNMQVNAKGVFLTDQAAVRLWLEHKRGGVIVNTASVAGKTGAPFLAHYCASKFAVVGFTQSLAREVAANGIRVNCVCPGYVRTSMQERELGWEARLRGLTADQVRAEYVALTPLGRLQEPADVASAVMFLASEQAAFITGEAVNVSGGAFMD